MSQILEGAGSPCGLSLSSIGQSQSSCNHSIKLSLIQYILIGGVIMQFPSDSWFQGAKSVGCGSRNLLKEVERCFKLWFLLWNTSFCGSKFHEYFPSCLNSQNFSGIAQEIGLKSGKMGYINLSMVIVLENYKVCSDIIASLYVNREISSQSYLDRQLKWCQWHSMRK